MKVCSLFAGIGGFDLALTNLGHEIVWANEWDKYAAQIYENNFSNTGHNQRGESQTEREGMEVGGSVHTSGKREVSNHPRVDTRDITTVSTSEIPDFDLLVGGFPCQAFSVAGKRKGFDDTRGTLFFEIARILRDKRPRYFVLENVKGLLSHDSGKTFQTILGVLTQLGYEFEWQVLNSKNFGVPQNRERVFIVGYSRGESRPKVFPITGSNSNIDAGGVQGENTQAITSRYGNGNARGTHISRYPLKFLQRNQKNIEGDYAFTVDGANTGGVKHGMSIRRLTPIECERLQGFPDGWTEGVSDTQRYKCLGNAVTVNVVEAIARRAFL